MKKRIMILALLVFALTTTFIVVPQVKAASVIIHDHLTESRVKSEDGCSAAIHAVDPIVVKTGHYTIPGSDDVVWLRGLAYGTPTGAATVASTVRCSVLYIQFRSSDSNDGIADIYVDDMVNPIVRIDNYNRGHWYVEIRDLPWATHTVRVKASDNYDFTGVIVSPHHTTPDIDNEGDVHLWYFGFGERGVGGVWFPVDKLGLLAPYIGLAVAAVAITIGSVYARKRWPGKAVVQGP